MDVDSALTPPETNCRADGTSFSGTESGPAISVSPTATENAGQAIEAGAIPESMHSGSLDLGKPYVQVCRIGTHHFSDPSLPVDTDPFFAGFPALNLLSAQWPEAEGMTMDTNTSNELDDMELQFLDTYNITVPFELGDPFASLAPTEPPSRNSSDPGQPAAMCAEAFRNSLWHFRPNAKDYAGAEDHNLSLPPTLEYPSPESRLSVDSRVTCAKLGVSTRDRILTMVVKNCNPENVPRAILSFPSVELLDTLLQYYLTSPVTRASSFLHAATFDPNEKRPELLAAMAASGAVLTSDPALTKLGYAIAECVRFGIAKLVCLFRTHPPYSISATNARLSGTVRTRWYEIWNCLKRSVSFLIWACGVGTADESRLRRVFFSLH